jgi:hypothetical protein
VIAGSGESWFRQQTRGEDGNHFVDSSSEKSDNGDKRHIEVYLSLESDTLRTAPVKPNESGSIRGIRRAKKVRDLSRGMRRATEHRPDYLNKRFAWPQLDSCEIIESNSFACVWH